VSAQALEVDCASDRNIFAATTRLSFIPPSARIRIMAASNATIALSVEKNRA